MEVQGGIHLLKIYSVQNKHLLSVENIPKFYRYVGVGPTIYRVDNLTKRKWLMHNYHIFFYQMVNPIVGSTFIGVKMMGYPIHWEGICFGRLKFLISEPYSWDPHFYLGFLWQNERIVLFVNFFLRWRDEFRILTPFKWNWNSLYQERISSYFLDFYVE